MNKAIIYVSVSRSYKRIKKKKKKSRISRRKEAIKMRTKVNKTEARCQWLIHACNPRYSGGRDQEDLGSKSAQANSS
jgi:hypothetical protein